MQSLCRRQMLLKQESVRINSTPNGGGGIGRDQWKTMRALVHLVEKVGRAFQGEGASGDRVGGMASSQKPQHSGESGPQLGCVWWFWGKLGRNLTITCLSAGWMRMEMWDDQMAVAELQTVPWSPSLQAGVWAEGPGAAGTSSLPEAWWLCLLPVIRTVSFHPGPHSRLLEIATMWPRVRAARRNGTPCPAAMSPGTAGLRDRPSDRPLCRRALEPSTSITRVPPKLPLPSSQWTPRPPSSAPFPGRSKK